MGLKLQSVSGGSVELNAPVTATNYTVAIPAQSGTMMMAENYQPSFKNRIINGAMQISQRGTSIAAIGLGYYFVDRFKYDGAVPTAVVTAGQGTSVPASTTYQYNAYIQVTTSDTSIAATDAYTITHPIEGYNCYDLVGQTFTLSFWVRSPKTGVHCVSFRNSGSDRSYVAEYTISAVNTWEQKTITVTGGLIIAGTWNWTNGTGVAVSWSLASGSNYQTTANAWQTGNYFATANQVNCLDTVGNVFAITGVQLEKGSTATSFDYRPYGTELALCQRYYQSFLAAGTGFRMSTEGNGLLATPFNYLCTMRATPSCNSILNSGSADGENQAQFYPGQVSWSFARISQTSAVISAYLPSGISTTANIPWRCQFNASLSAEL